MSLRKELNELYVGMYSNVVRSLMMRQIFSITLNQEVVMWANDTTGKLTCLVSKF